MYREIHRNLLFVALLSRMAALASSGAKIGARNCQYCTVLREFCLRHVPRRFIVVIDKSVLGESESSHMTNVTSLISELGARASKEKYDAHLCTDVCIESLIDAHSHFWEDVQPQSSRSIVLRTSPTSPSTIL